jgi:hypothetical protein
MITEIRKYLNRFNKLIESMQILVEIGKTLRISSPLDFRGSKMYTHPEFFAPRTFQGLFFLALCDLLL